MKRTLCLLLLAVCFCAAPLRCIAQVRSQGVSLHMLPKRVADLGGDPWGFTVDHASTLRADARTIQSAAELLSYFRKQDKDVQANGVWIVVTDPDAYSDAEKLVLEDVKAMCRREKILLFICRAAELPDGWKRFDQ